MFQKAWSLAFARFIYKLFWEALGTPPHNDSFNFWLLIFQYFFIFRWLLLLAHYLFNLSIWWSKDRIPTLLPKLFLLFYMINKCIMHLFLIFWLFLWGFDFFLNFFPRLFFLIFRNLLVFLLYFLFWLLLELRLIVIFNRDNSKYYIWKLLQTGFY